MANDSLGPVNGVLVWTSTATYPAMRAFYLETLGLTPRGEKDGFINFAWGEFRLSVSVHHGVEGSARDPLRIMLNFSVDDIHAAHARLASLGVAFSRPPEQEPWGGWVATFTDPDGNTLQLLQP